jgi:hypothetical protein
MTSSSTTDSDVTETFSNSELDTDSLCDFDNEPDSGREEEDTERSFEERTWRVDFL